MWLRGRSQISTVNTSTIWLGDQLNHLSWSGLSWSKTKCHHHTIKEPACMLVASLLRTPLDIFRKGIRRCHRRRNGVPRWAPALGAGRGRRHQPRGRGQSPSGRAVRPQRPRRLRALICHGAHRHGHRGGAGLQRHVRALRALQLQSHVFFRHYIDLRGFGSTDDIKNWTGKRREFADIVGVVHERTSKGCRIVG